MTIRRVRIYFVIVLSTFLLRGFSSASINCPVGDLDGDCRVEMADLLVFSEQWLSEPDCVETGLVGRWKLDETEGEFASNSVLGLAGVLTGDMHWRPYEGRLGGALRLDGDGDYIEVTGYKGISGAGARTCAIWINTASVSGDLFCWGDETGPGALWNMRINYMGNLRVQTVGGAIYSNAVVNAEQWVHVAAVLPAGAGNIRDVRLYINGIPQSSEEVTISPAALNTAVGSDVRIGADLQGHYFNGLLDDARIYNRALSDEEIWRLVWNGTTAPDCVDMDGMTGVGLGDLSRISENWQTAYGPVVISEFMADNETDDLEAGRQFSDGHGEFSDWIELYNISDQAVDLSGWALTDKDDDLDPWRFPAGLTLGAGQYLVVFASGKTSQTPPYRDPAGYYHTNFKLATDPPEYLALMDAAGAIVHEYARYEYEPGRFGYPPQEENISYGLYFGQEQYFTKFTPKKNNISGFSGIVEKPKFFPERGFYDIPAGGDPLQVAITCGTPGAKIYYTLDGSDPVPGKGILYSEPISLNSTKCIRAAAYRPGWHTPKNATHTYLVNADAKIKGMPVVCLAGEPGETFYPPNGVMSIVGGSWSSGEWRAVNPGDYNYIVEAMNTNDPMLYERPVSAEYIEPEDNSGFQEDCGLRVHGSDWMRPRYRPASPIGQWYGDSKISLRLYFRDQYGKNRLEYPLFPFRVEKFKSIVLRGGHNDRDNPFIRDELQRRLHKDMGNVASGGIFVNLFVNGDYKGYFNPCEHIKSQFCQEWFDSDYDWDVQTMSGIRDGDTISWNAMINFAQNNNLSDAANYRQMRKLLDVPNFIDYIMLQTYGGNWDWPQNNWSAAAERSSNPQWRFFIWDIEGGMDQSVTGNSRFAELNSQGNANGILYRALKNNPDYRQMYCDRMQKHFLESGGALSKEHINQRFWELADQVKPVIPYINQSIPNTWIPQREGYYFGWTRTEGLWTFAAPNLLLNGQIYEGKYASKGDSLSLSLASGTSGKIYYTRDGSDPRVSNDIEVDVTTLVPENAAKKILVPTRDIGASWRGGSEPFNDAGWTDGTYVSGRTGGIGYERSSGYENYISYDLNQTMGSTYTSAYFRVPFTLTSEQINSFDYMTLKVRWDDGFVVYLNGYEVKRSSTIGDSTVVQWNTRPAGRSGDSAAFETFLISGHVNRLRIGNNILAVHGMNSSTGSSDFLISVELVAGESLGQSGGISEKAQEYTQPIPLDRSVSLKARTLNGDQWSALRETVYSVDPLMENLRMTEIMYNPSSSVDPNTEYIELCNIGSESINPVLVKCTEGIEFTFGNMTLAPQQNILLVRDRDKFLQQYPGLEDLIAGQFSGRLDDGGERVTLTDAAGSVIQSVSYGDGWYPLSDGEGFSLTAQAEALQGAILPQGGRTGLWLFDETAGTTAYDHWGVHHGTYVHTDAGASVAGRYGRAVLLDGQDDYVVLPFVLDVEPTRPMSLFAWVRLDGRVPERLQVLFQQENTYETSALLGWDRYDQLASKLGNVWTTSTCKLTQDLGRWMHVGLVYDGQGTLKLYKDGRVVAESVVTPLVESGPLRIGSHIENRLYWDGAIDQVCLYSRALSGDEVDALYNPWDEKSAWRLSAQRHGSPGTDDTGQVPEPGAVVINEVLSHSHGNDPDWIELHNTTDAPIPIGGWFLSDSDGDDSNRMKYEIQAGTVIPEGGYIVFNQRDHFGNPSAPGCHIPFALSEGGDTLSLRSGQGGQLTGYVDQEDFGAAETGVAFGRYRKSTGTYNFVAMATNTPWNDNAGPKRGPVAITEIMYNPGTPPQDPDLEYIEIRNISGQTFVFQNLADTATGPTGYVLEYVPWKITDGIEFTFPMNVTLSADEVLLLVRDEAAFRAHYTDVPSGTRIFEWDSGRLDNAGEKIELSMAGDQEWQQDRYYIRVEQISYDDKALWPIGADRTGKSLTRIDPTAYGNDPANWQAADPSPGR